MLRTIVKMGIKSTLLAFEKIKYGLGCMKENLEDITAEVKSELRVESNEGVSQQNPTTQEATEVYAPVKKKNSKTVEETTTC